MSRTIIVADDDQEIREDIEANLTLNGYTVRAVENGEEALRLAIALQPEMVLLDIAMPEMDGFQACKKIREHPTTSAIPVILLSSKTQGSEKIRGLELGADDYVEKPIEWAEFKARVASLLRRANQLRDLSPLTNLPGNYRITSELSQLVADPSIKYAVLNIEINHFKSINDRYGSDRGDKVIKFLSSILSDIMSKRTGKPSTLGHIGGSRFVIITKAEGVEDICNEIMSRFDKGIVEIYDDDATAKGYVELVNRKNEPVKHPIVTVAIGVVSTQFRELRSQWEATATAAEMCEHAKRHDNSAFEVDRRHTDDQFLAMLDGES